MLLVDVPGSLRRGGMVEITTTGRRTGLPRRVAIAAHNVEGRVFLSGRPGRRSWYANLVARPELTLHMSYGSMTVAVPARARPITGLEERRRILEPIAAGWQMSLPVMVRSSPLVELSFEEVHPPVEVEPPVS